MRTQLNGVSKRNPMILSSIHTHSRSLESCTYKSILLFTLFDWFVPFCVAIGYTIFDTIRNLSAYTAAAAHNDANKTPRITRCRRQEFFVCVHIC